MTLHHLIAKWPRVFGVFFGLTVIAASSLLTGCGAAEDRLEDGPRIYRCVSNIGRPVLTFDSKTLKVSFVAFGPASYISFTNIDTGLRHVLYTKEDRDYTSIRLTHKLRSEL